MLADLCEMIFRDLQRLSLASSADAPALVSRLTNDVEALDHRVTDGVTSLFQNTLILVGSAAILFDPRLEARARHARRFCSWRSRRRSSASSPRVPTGRSGNGSALVTATLAEDIAGMRDRAGVQPPVRETSANFREGHDPLPRRQNHVTVVTQRPLLPVCRLPVHRERPRSCSATAAISYFGEQTSRSARSSPS